MTHVWDALELAVIYVSFAHYDMSHDGQALVFHALFGNTWNGPGSFPTQPQLREQYEKLETRPIDNVPYGEHALLAIEGAILKLPGIEGAFKKWPSIAPPVSSKHGAAVPAQDDTAMMDSQKSTDRPILTGESEALAQSEIRRPIDRTSYQPYAGTGPRLAGPSRDHAPPHLPQVSPATPAGPTGYHPPPPQQVPSERLPAGFYGYRVPPPPQQHPFPPSERDPDPSRLFLGSPADLQARDERIGIVRPRTMLSASYDNHETWLLMRDNGYKYVSEIPHDVVAGMSAKAQELIRERKEAAENIMSFNGESPGV